MNMSFRDVDSKVSREVGGDGKLNIFLTPLDTPSTFGALNFQNSNFFENIANYYILNNINHKKKTLINHKINQEKKLWV